MWIIEPPPKSLIIKHGYSVPYWAYQKAVKRIKFLDTEIEIFNDGLIVCKTNDKYKSFENINLFIAAVNIFSFLENKNIISFAVSPIDLIEFRKIKIGKNVQLSIVAENIYSIRCRPIFDPEFSGRRVLYDIERRKIISEQDLEKIEQILKLIENKIEQDNNIKNLLIAFVDALTYYWEKKCREAFILGWSIIEYFIEKLIITYFPSLSKKKSRKKCGKIY